MRPLASRGARKSVASSAWSTPPWLHGLQRRSRQPARIAPLHQPVLAERVERVLRAGRVVLARAGRRQQAEACSATRWTSADAERTSCGRLPEHLVDLLDEPLVAARLGRLGDARRGRRARSPAPAGPSAASSRQVSRSCRLIRLRTTALPTDLRHGEAEPRLAVRVVLAREPVERQVPRRDRAALPVDRVEVPRAGQAVPALHGRAGAQAERRLRPLARRRFRIAWPARVDMRARKPCLRLRRRTFGW